MLTVLGWNVTSQTEFWGFATYKVTANPNDFATNGLVNDFLEKELGLNPNRLDTTDSHMLDTWNLTFDLGAGSPALPSSGFEYWYENSSYHFNLACPVPERGPCSFTPLDVHARNLTATGTRNPGGDNSPWGAQVLWSGTGTNNSLSQLQHLMQVGNEGWLRAVTGSYNGNRTITVWGKLSWGANPLAYSTIDNESYFGGLVPDGARVDPLGATNLNVTLSSWSASGLANGDGVGVFIHGTSAWDPYFGGQTDYSDYSINSSSPGGKDTYLGTFTVDFPVVSTEQYANLNFSVVAATSHGLIWDNTSSVQVDLEQSAIVVDRFHGTRQAQNFTLNVTYQCVAVYSKARTMILVPGDNSTMNNLPDGLRRYTAEQNFVLLEVNDTSGNVSLPLSGTGVIPYVNATAFGNASTGLYGVSLAPGINNVLVPRVLFMSSLLGQALLNNTTIWMRNESYQGPLDSEFDPTFWKAGVTGGKYHGISFSNPSPYHIALYSNTDQSCTLSYACGGVASDGAVEARAPSYAVGAVFTLNVSTSLELDSLVAGLVLNRSGNITNSLINDTSGLTTLGLSPVVLKLLANQVLFNQGSYQVPVYTPPPPSPTVWPAVGASIWNVASGVAAYTGLSAFWNWIAAAGAYFAYLEIALGEFALSMVLGAINILVEVAGAFNWLLEEIRALIIAAATIVVNTALGAFFGSRSACGNSVESAITSGGSQQFWQAIGCGVFLAGIVVGIALIVGLTIVNGIGLGADFVISIIVGLVLSLGFAALQYLMPGMTSPSEQMVGTLQSFSGEYTSQSHQAANWTSISNAFGTWETGTSDTYAFLYLKSAWATERGGWRYQAQICSLAFALLGSAFDYFSTTESGGGAVLANDIALVSAGVSVVLEIPALKYPAPTADVQDRALDQIIFALDLADFGLAVAGLSQGK